MKNKILSLNYDKAAGLLLSWDAGNGIVLHDISVRLRLCGHNVFYVWMNIPSGEGPPAWAEKNLDIPLFAPATKQMMEQSCRLSHLEGPDGDVYIALARCARAQARLEISLRDGVLNYSLSLRNPQPPGGRPLPVCLAELTIKGLDLSHQAEFLSSHNYGGRTHGAGTYADITSLGLPFIYGCIGLGMPLVYLRNPTMDAGLEMEFMLDGRPTAWLRKGQKTGTLDWCLQWTPDRLLLPGEEHAFGGTARITPFKGSAIKKMRQWRDAASSRYGLTPPSVPDWLRRGNMIEINLNPENELKGFTRLDDLTCRRLMQNWREMGYDVLFTVSQFSAGKNWLSPFDYEPANAVGGLNAEKQFLNWARELGFHVIIWITTVGLDSEADVVRKYPQWFTFRPHGQLFYAWDSHFPDFIGYAPDADPLATGWRTWLKKQVSRIIARGYHGIFIDGCIPRASNHARWLWPGQSRNGVEGQVCELAAHVRTKGQDLVTFVEDGSLALQAACEMTMGRYVPITPFQKELFWDHGMGGHPELEITPPRRINPEEARDYLLVRYASMLPGALSNDIVEGYYSEESRPWTVQSLMSGTVPKTHSQFVDDPITFRFLSDAPEPSASEREPEHRHLGTCEFLSLLQLRRNEPLIQSAPLSIEGVRVDGDRAVVGLLRPGEHRCLLILIQFANRPAKVSVQLMEPVDVPAIVRQAVGRPDLVNWRTHEILRSMMETEPAKDALITSTKSLEVGLAPFSFRIFELLQK